MKIMTIEKKKKILSIAEDRLKDGHHFIVIDQDEIKLLANILEKGYLSGEINLDLELGE